METYVVAVKRECRGQAPPQWRQLVEAIEAAEVIGDESTRALRVVGPPGIGKELVKAVGSFCHIEAVISHHKSDR